MKVYTQDGESQSMFGGLLVTFVFFVYSLYIFISFIQSKNIAETLADLGVGLVFALIFFVIATYFIILLLKKPKSFTAELVKKEIQVYKGKIITYMEFVTFEAENKIGMHYFCYTYGENNLILNKKYLIKVKEFNWNIKRVEEENGSAWALSVGIE